MSIASPQISRPSGIAGSKGKQSMQVHQVGSSFRSPTTEQISLRQ